jgi:hypothetical protein
LTAQANAPSFEIDSDIQRVGADLSGAEPAEELVAPELRADVRALLALTDPVERHRAGDRIMIAPENDYVGDHKAYILGPFVRPGLSRFSDGSFGVLYAALAYETARAEAAYWMAHFFADSSATAGSVSRKRWLSLRATSQDLADLRRTSGGIESIYDPDDYQIPRQLGLALHESGREGVYYDSVRNKGGECVGAFVPRIVSNVQLKQVVEFVWDGTRISEARLIELL